MNTQRNEKGFTLIELIVVVAIMGIVGAALVPQFTTMSKRSRISTDVSTVKAATTQVDVYFNQTDKWPGSNEGQVVSTLMSAQLLDRRYLSLQGVSNWSLNMKTNSAKVAYTTDSKFVLQVTPDEYKLYQDSADKSQGWIVSSAITGAQTAQH